MKTKILFKLLIFCLLIITLPVWESCTNKIQTESEVMDAIVRRLYATKTEQELTALTNETIMGLITKSERKVLSSGHWMFDVNVPVVVSVMRDNRQSLVPFWLPENGFKKTVMTMKNEQTGFEVWQKSFPAGKIGLGIHGFDNSGLHYFVSVAPQDDKQELILSNFYPESQFIGTLQDGAFTYHDWDELVLSNVLVSMKGQKLLTTVRGRATESHLVNAFRKTQYPSSQNPDQVLLTWSSDPSTTVDIQWRTDTSIKNGRVVFRENNSVKTDSVQSDIILMNDRMLMNDPSIHHHTAHLTGLKPGTTYNYLIRPWADWSKAQTFTTAAADSSFSFLWFGDTHFSPKFGENLKNACNNHPDASFFTIAGDLVSDGLHRNQWDELLEYSKNTISRIPLMAVPGNHDNRAGLGARTFRDLFSYPENGPEEVEPEQTYAFTYKNCLFLMIDATSPIEAQTKWIENQLAQTRAKWKIAVFHFPPYNQEEPYTGIQNTWVPLFDKFHVDLVLGGHVHYYMRSKPLYGGKPVSSFSEGTVYMISIAIPTRGRQLPGEYQAEVLSSAGQLSQYVKIDGPVLTLLTTDIQGNLIDSFTIKK